VSSGTSKVIVFPEVKNGVATWNCPKCGTQNTCYTKKAEIVQCINCLKKHKISHKLNGWDSQDAKI